MAKRYTASLDFKCWKEHTCSCCGGVYTYMLQRKLTGQAASEPGARKNLDKMIQWTAKHDSDMQPCPTCGYYQEDMVGKGLRSARKGLFWAALLPVILILIFRGSDLMQSGTVTWIAVGFAALWLLLHLMFSFRNPNKDVETNRRLAQERIAGGTLHDQTPGQDTSARPQNMTRHTKSAAFLIGMAALAAAIPLAYWPEGLRAMKGWAANEDCYPPVVGAGDTTRIYMQDKITSMKGYWRGMPVAKLKIEGRDKPVELNASTNENNWGMEIRVKESEKNSTARPWVNVTLPAGIETAGKAGSITIDLAVEFPAFKVDHFENDRANLHRSVDVKLSPAGAGSQYDGAWWMGTAIGGGLVIVGSAILFFAAKSYQAKAKPTQVYPVETAGS
jgi:hypothetical protein